MRNPLLADGVGARCANIATHLLAGVAGGGAIRGGGNCLLGDKVADSSADAAPSGDGANHIKGFGLRGVWIHSESVV